VKVRSPIEGVLQTLCKNQFQKRILNGRSRDNSVVKKMRWTAGVQFPTEARFFLLRRVQTDFGVHPASYPVGTVGSFPGAKRPRRETVHSLPSSAEVKKSGTVRPQAHMSSWHGDNFIFTFNFECIQARSTKP
jgi:hypothetical protein